MARHPFFAPVMACGCFLIALVLGCGGSNVPTGTINGKVTLKGQPAPTGTVVSFGSADSARTGVVSSDGTFTVMGIPIGKYQVSFASPAAESFPDDPKQAMMKAMENQQKGKTEAPPAQIPAKYQNIATSGISFEVQQGSNDFTYDIKE